MEEDVLFEKKFSIRGGDFAGAGEASIEAKNILKEIGFDGDVIRRVAIASYEAEMNVVMYADYGEMDFKVMRDGVRIVVDDRGPGIPDIDMAMKEGYSTATDEMREMGFGAGMGLPNIKKNTDELKISSRVDTGTRVEMFIKSKVLKTDE